MDTISLRRAQGSRAFRRISFFLTANFLFLALPPAALGEALFITPHSGNVASPGSAASNNAANNMFDLSNMNMQQGQQNQSQGQQMQNQAQVMQGMMQMALAALQALMAALGAMAGQKAGDQAKKDNGNASGLSSLNPYSSTVSAATSPTPDSPNTSSSSTGEKSGSDLDLSENGIRVGPIGKAMDGLEKNFGLNRDAVMKALKDGVSPKDILANAPKNAPSADMLDKLAERLSAQIASDGAAAASKIAGGALPKGSDTPSSAASASTAGGEEAGAGNRLRLPASTAPDMGEIPGDVSPEVRAALAAKAAAQLQADRDKFTDPAGWSLFQLVHHRYQKVGAMLYGRVEVTNVSSVPAQLR